MKANRQWQEEKTAAQPKHPPKGPKGGGADAGK